MVLPRRPFGDEGLAVAFGAVELEKQAFGAADTPDATVAMLLFFTSLSFLIPARTSFYLGRLWHAWVFALMSAFCAAYNVFSSSLPIDSDMRRWLTLAHHSWAYFCFLQIAFLVLGPEDPHMQWIDHPVVLDTPRSALAMAPPLHAIVLTRVLPLGVMFVFLCCFASADDFHWQMVIINDALLLFGCSAFWMHRDRRSSMPKVLLRVRFWRRLWNHCALPGLLASFIWALMESTDSRVMHCVWHVLIATLVVSIMRVVHDSGDLHWKAEIMNVSTQNPVIARILLGSVAMFGLPTLIFSLVLDWWAVGFWRWPMVCKATHQQPGGYFVVIGALPTFLALATAFRLISSTVGSPQADPQEIVLSKQFGCMIGYVSIFFGLLALAFPDPSFPTLHTFCMIAFLCLMMVATMLTTLSARYPLASGNRCRFFLTLAIFFSVMVFLMLLILVEQYIPNTYSIPHPVLAMSEYITLALPMLWPLTWGPEVQARWQAHKVWRTFHSNQMA